MRYDNLTLFVLLTLLVLNSCGLEQSQPKEGAQTEFVELGDDITSIPDSIFKSLDNWLAEYKIVGFGEGDHGMNESLDFRNSYIKYLVKTKQIRILAFESGLVESKMVNDYINGLDLDLDSVLSNGMTYTFGQFVQSKELLTWLRDENKTRKPENRVQFYGLDMAGNAPNPYLENSSFALERCLDYLQLTDLKTYQKYANEVEYYLPFLCTKNDPDSKEISFIDLPQEKRESLLALHDDLISVIEKNEEQYIKVNGLEAYDWALQTAKCAKQNIIFLEGYNASPRDQSTREKFMLDNLEWIMNREGDEKVFLFAHLAHLAKNISIIDSTGQEVRTENFFGEHLENKFGNDYKLVANTYCYVDYYTEVDSVQTNSFPYQLKKRYETPNFLLKINKTDPLFNQLQICGSPTLSGDVYILPNKGMEIIFHTEKQHFFYKE